jgi:hypothetical protein
MSLENLKPEMTEPISTKKTSFQPVWVREVFAEV